MRPLLSQAETLRIPVCNPLYPRCGAFCNVFLATFEGREVAVKMLKPEHRGSDTAQKDLESEITLLRALSHRHLPKLFAMGTLESSLFVVSTNSAVVNSSTTQTPTP
jgi:serine/threonine protein kinase